MRRMDEELKAQTAAVFYPYKMKPERKPGVEAITQNAHMDSELGLSSELRLSPAFSGGPGVVIKVHQA